MTFIETKLSDSKLHFRILPFDFSGYQQLIRHLLQNFSEYKIWSLNGDLGAGKTTFVQHFGLEKSISDQVSSPTFSLINEYLTPENAMIYHMDFYRLKSLEEAISIGIPDYLDSGNYCLVEWADLFPQFFDTSHLHFQFKANQDQSREIILTTYENRN